jgi:hypothetical protein
MPRLVDTQDGALSDIDNEEQMCWKKQTPSLILLPDVGDKGRDPMSKSRLVRKIVIGVVVLLVVVVVGAWVMIDSLAKHAVQQGGEYALGVPTTVDTLTLSLLGGSLRMDTLNVANPAGYKGAHLMRTGKFNLAVDTGSVFGDTVRIPTLELDGLDLIIEPKGLKNNVEEILDNVK